MKPTEHFDQFRKGMLQTAVLSSLERQSAYAADILGRLSGGEFETTEGGLYPLLSKLKRQGLLQYEWAESPSGPPRKYYRLTDEGRRHLAASKTYIRQLLITLDQLGEHHA